MTELWRDDFYRVLREPALVRLVRTATPYPSLQRMDASNQALAAALRSSGGRRVLLDLRAGPPGRNDEAYERASADARAALAANFERVAVVVRSVAGKLQVQRLSKSEQRGGQSAVFLDEAAALAYLSAD